MILPCLTIAPTKLRGRGVFTTENLPANTIIEISPVLVFPVNEVETAEKTLLYNYFFEWGKSSRKRALGLGYISLYNHSYNANCDYEMDFENAIMQIITVEPVKKGEELFINYNAEPKNTKPIWFDAH